MTRMTRMLEFACAAYAVSGRGPAGPRSPRPQSMTSVRRSERRMYASLGKRFEVTGCAVGLSAAADPAAASARGTGAAFGIAEADSWRRCGCWSEGRRSRAPTRNHGRPTRRSSCEARASRAAQATEPAAPRVPGGLCPLCGGPRCVPRPDLAKGDDRRVKAVRTGPPQHLGHAGPGSAGQSFSEATQHDTRPVSPGAPGGHDERRCSGSEAASRSARSKPEVGLDIYRFVDEFASAMAFNTFASDV